MEEPCGNPRKPETLPLEQARSLVMRPRPVVITPRPCAKPETLPLEQHYPEPYPEPYP